MRLVTDQIAIAMDRQRTAEAGFAHHLLKPVDFAKLRQLLSDTPAGH